MRIRPEEIEPLVAADGDGDRPMLMKYAFVVLISCVALFGCAEAEFVLAPESRLPAWFALPDGLTRSQVTVTLTYYEPPSGGTAVLKMFGPNRRLLSEVNGIVRKPRRDARGAELALTAPVVYPSYEVVTANGITDVMEHRLQEPIFYVTDDPEIRRALGVAQAPSSSSPLR